MIYFGFLMYVSWHVVRVSSSGASVHRHRQTCHLCPVWTYCPHCSYPQESWSYNWCKLLASSIAYSQPMSYSVAVFCLCYDWPHSRSRAWCTNRQGWLGRVCGRQYHHIWANLRSQSFLPESPARLCLMLLIHDVQVRSYVLFVLVSMFLRLSTSVTFPSWQLLLARFLFTFGPSSY